MRFTRPSPLVFILSLCMYVSLQPTTASAGGNAAKGKANYVVCVTCHGAQGEGKKVLNAPALVGQQDWYLIRQLKNYKAGIRGTHTKDIYGMQMRPMSMTLARPQDIANVVAYIQTLKAKPQKATIKGDVKKGKMKYMLCTTCHGAKAEGKKALNAPALVNLQDWYMVRQLQNYKSGVRGTHAKDVYGKQMRPMSMTLATQKDIINVVAYIKSLKKK